LAIIFFVGTFFTGRIGLNPYCKLATIALSFRFFYASYKTKSKNIEKIDSKNIEVDKSPRKYLAFPRTKEQEEALDIIFDGISLGRDGIGFSTLRKIIALAPSLYKAGDKIRYNESEGKISGVHPLRHLGYLFANEVTRQRLKVVMNYKGFLEKVKKTYIKEMSKILNQLNELNQIVPYLTDFVEELTSIDKMSKASKKALVDSLTIIVQKNDQNKWEEFIQIIFTKIN